MTQIKSQILGLLLGLSTAIGCIFYEKIVGNLTFGVLSLLKIIEVIIFAAIGYFIFDNTSLSSGIKSFTADPKYWIWSIVYVLSGVTTLFWYNITKNQGVMVGSLYEIKYIVMLSLFYIMFGGDKFTINTMIGLVLALLSIYFISKS